MTTKYNTATLCESLRWFGQPATIRAAEVIESLEKQVAAYAEGRKDQLEEMAAISLLLCWEATELSEGQLSKLLELDRVELREMRLEAIQAGLKLAEQLAKGVLA